MAATPPNELEPGEHTTPRGSHAVPEKPTTEMLAAGSTAGGVSVEATWNIYRAMLKAAT